jgi:hypothetical protein
LELRDHGLISTAGAAALLAGGAGWDAAGAFWAAGIFVDLDHFHDYWRETGWNLDLKRFFAYFPGAKPKQLVLLLHSWEWMLLVPAALWLGGASSWLFWAWAGWLQHLILDQRFNYLNPKTYFFYYRWSHGFSARKIYG